MYLWLLFDCFNWFWLFDLCFFLQFLFIFLEKAIMIFLNMFQQLLLRFLFLLWLFSLVHDNVIMIDDNTFRLRQVICLFLLSFFAVDRLTYSIIRFNNELFWRLFLQSHHRLFMNRRFHWDRLDRMKQLVFHLESLSCPWRVLFTLYELGHIRRRLVMILDVVIPFFEVMELVSILVYMLFLLLSRAKIWPSLKFALSGVLQPFNVSLLQTDDISSLEGTILDFALLDRSLWDIRRGIELATEGSFVDLEFEYLLVRVYKILIFVLILKSVL